MDRYETTNDDVLRVMQWAYDLGRISVTTTGTWRGVHLPNNQLDTLLGVGRSPSCRITWDGSRFSMKAEKGSGYPCVAISWFGAAAYCNFRSEIEGRVPFYDLEDWTITSSADGYRIPTAEQWEYAARGGLVGKRFPWGDTISHGQANYIGVGGFLSYDLSEGWHPTYFTGEEPYTSPAGAFAPNAYGLYDMAGNVEEWCTDWHPCSIGTHRVFKGGLTGGTARVAYRGMSKYPGRLGPSNGFRTVLPSGP